MRIIESASPLRRRAPAYLESAICILAILVGPCILLAPSLSEGKLPWSADPLYLLAPWSEARPADLAEPRMDDIDFLYRHYPWYRYLGEHAHDPLSLLWNPREGGGTPFFTLWRTRCLSPFSIPFYVLPIASALIVSVLAKFMVAGLCAYYAARKMELHKAFALFAAIAFQFSSVLFLFRGGPISDSMVWLPLIIMYIDAWVTHKSAPWRSHAFVSLLIMLGGAPEVGAAILLLAVLFPIVLAGTRRLSVTHAAWAFGIYCVMSVVGAGLAAVQLIPTIFTALDVELAVFRDDTALSIRHLANLVYIPGGTGRDPALLHFGWAALVWFPLWFAVRPWIPAGQCRRIEGLVLAGVITSVTGLAIFLYAERAGLFLQHALAAAIAPMPFLLAIAAGAACEEWTHLDERQTAQAIRRLAILGPLMALVMLGLLPWAFANATDEPWWRFTTPFALAFAAVFLLGWTLLRPSVRTMGYGVVALAIVNCALTLTPHLRFDPAERFFPETSLTKSLHELKGRIGGTPALADWPLAGNGLEQFYTPARAYTRQQAELIQALVDDPLLVRRTGSKELLLDREAIQGPFASVRPDLRVKHVFTTGAVLFEDLHMATRARIEPIAGPGDGDLIPARVMPSANSSETRITADTDVPARLVLADMNLPGWTAEVDGEPARIETAEGGFRSVQLAPGSHQVTFRYRPRSVIYGALVSFVTLFGIVLSAVLHIMGRNREGRV